jgi:choline dehydrogenase-like flavoprotein
MTIASTVFFASIRENAVDKAYDIIIIGTGAGGSTIAHSLAPTGKKILILERGDFLVRSKDNWDPEKVFREEIYHTQEKWLTKEGGEFRPGQAYLVGGNTKVFGAALLRLRKKDFEEIAYEDGISPAWPITYEELEPHYQEAERLYFVHGQRGEDPTEPPASKPFPYPKLSQEPRMLEVYNQLRSLGIKAFHLPIGVQRFEDNIAGSPCIRCNTCDGFPCLVNAKGDAEQACLIHALRHPNVTLLTGAKVEHVETSENGLRATGVHVIVRGETKRFEGETIILSAGAINSAVILLKSATAKHPNGLANSSGLVGRNYMCHTNSAMIAIDPFKKNPTIFQKTMAINDFYFGGPKDPVGHISLIGKATEGILKAEKPFAPRFILKFMAEHSMDWWFQTEDLPRKENGVVLTPEGRIRLNWTQSNRAPHERLISHWKKILWKIGFRVMLTQSMPINAVAHQVGTCVMGKNTATSVVNTNNRTHDVENLYVVDGSFFPSASAVNPALTIAANALRVGDKIKEHLGVKKEAEHAMA